MMYLGRYSKLFEYVGLKIMTQVTNNIYETSDWPKDFVEGTITALKKSQKLQYAATTAHAAKTVAWIFRERNVGCKWGAENIRTNFGHRRRNVCLLHRLAESI
jgi:hypothetical protein